MFFACRTREVDAAGLLSGAADELLEVDWSVPGGEDARETARLCRAAGADAAVVDLCRDAAGFQRVFLDAGIRWLQFDWTARGPLWADWVLNPSPAADEEVYRRVRMRKETELLLGPAYALLRPQFTEWRRRTVFREEVRRILLTFGGGDDRGAAVFCLEAIAALDSSIERVVMAGSANPRLAETRNRVEKSGARNISLLVDEQNVARRMAESDVAIVAGGGTTFEAAAMGLPCLIVHLAGDQAANAAAWERLGAALHLGAFGEVTAAQIERGVAALVNDPLRRREMARAGQAAVDCGGARRVAERLLLAFGETAVEGGGEER